MAYEVRHLDGCILHLALGLSGSKLLAVQTHLGFQAAMDMEQLPRALLLRRPAIHPKEVFEKALVPERIRKSLQN